MNRARKVVHEAKRRWAPPPDLTASECADPCYHPGVTANPLPGLEAVLGAPQAQSTQNDQEVQCTRRIRDR